MTTEATAHPAAQPADAAEIGELRDRSDLMAEAARWIDAASYDSNSPIDWGPRPDGDPHYGEKATALREHAGVLVQMDQAESLGQLVEASIKAGARAALVGERLIGAVETAGQSTTVALGQIVAQLEKLNANLDGHRAALVDTAGELRAEVENLADAVGTVEREVGEVGLAVDRVGTSIDCLDTEVQTRRATNAHAQRVSAARGLMLGSLLAWSAALTVLIWAWIATTDPQLPDWMAPVGFGSGGVLALVAALLTGAFLARGNVTVEPATPAGWGGAISSATSGGKSVELIGEPEVRS